MKKSVQLMSPTFTELQKKHKYAFNACMHSQTEVDNLVLALTKWGLKVYFKEAYMGNVIIAEDT